MLGLVTQTSVYHWFIEGESEPAKMFDRMANLANNQIITADVILPKNGWVHKAAAKRQDNEGVCVCADVYDEVDGEESSRLEFMFPFCAEDYDVVGICCHIDEEHAVEVKNGELGDMALVEGKMASIPFHTRFLPSTDLVVESPPQPPLTTTNNHQLLPPPAPTASVASANHQVPPLFRI
ncbi:hypothetical protein RHGRI_033788 [Rhododendron griersonianum]|uniref:Di19 zinc-binding domain-containing protein n=1 Tax=Rhododendron griersonianum TaxID=479676 RepID=A0AAV6I157_9ERIC|nr:hypothetical protein RHGRI_033788 [Rhododendron griersonianum]